MSETTRQGHRQGGPPPLVPALAYGALTITAGIVYTSGPRPSWSATAVLRYAQTHTGLMHAVAFLVFGAAIPLVVWSATVHRRLRRAGVSAPGVDMALAGGILAAGSLAVSGLATWVVAATAHSLDAATARALTQLAFAAGAAGFVVPFGLLVAGTSVPMLLIGSPTRTTRALAWAGLAVAAMAMVASVTLLTPALDVLLPIARFGGLLWLLVASVLLGTWRIHAAGGRLARAGNEPADASADETATR